MMRARGVRSHVAMWRSAGTPTGSANMPFALRHPTSKPRPFKAMPARRARRTAPKECCPPRFRPYVADGCSHQDVSERCNDSRTVEHKLYLMKRPRAECELPGTMFPVQKAALTTKIALFSDKIAPRKSDHLVKMSVPSFHEARRRSRREGTVRHRSCQSILKQHFPV